MAPLVILIVLCSTFMHAGWNLLARYERSESIFYGKMLMVIAIIGLVPAVWSEIVTRSITLKAWVCVVGSAISAAVYLFALARAFESLDFTVVYPVARSLPVIFVAIIDVLRGRYLTGIGWLGILLVASGCSLVPLRSFGEFALRRYLNRASVWMLLAALGTVGYTLLDKVAAEVVQRARPQRRAMAICISRCLWCLMPHYCACPRMSITTLTLWDGSSPFPLPL